MAEADTDAVLSTLKETELEVAAAHVGLDALENEYGETTALYDELGAEDLAVP